MNTHHRAQYRQWKKRPTKRTASLDDFYSLIEPGGERKDAIEDLLHEYETPVALLLERDLEARRIPDSCPAVHLVRTRRPPATGARAWRTPVPCGCLPGPSERFS